MVDRRLLPGETEAGVVGEINQMVRKRKLKVSFVKGKPACLPLETKSSLPLVQQFLSSMGQRKPAGVHYFCDASVLSHGGIPSVVFGPGDIAQAHTADEWITLASVQKGWRILMRFLESLP
jgi:acetylornithine deacetylase